MVSDVLRPTAEPLPGEEQHLGRRAGGALPGRSRVNWDLSSGEAAGWAAGRAPPLQGYSLASLIGSRAWQGWAQISCRERRGSRGQPGCFCFWSLLAGKSRAAGCGRRQARVYAALVPDGGLQRQVYRWGPHACPHSPSLLSCQAFPLRGPGGRWGEGSGRSAGRRPTQAGKAPGIQTAVTDSRDQPPTSDQRTREGGWRDSGTQFAILFKVSLFKEPRGVSGNGTDPEEKAARFPSGPSRGPEG